MTSNGEWGMMHDDSAAQQRYDDFINHATPLPHRGENKMLDSLCDAKGLDPEALMAIGARLANYMGRESIVYFFPDGFKYRTLEDGSRASV